MSEKEIILSETESNSETEELENDSVEEIKEKCKPKAKGKPKGKPKAKPKPKAKASPPKSEPPDKETKKTAASGDDSKKLSSKKTRVKGKVIQISKNLDKYGEENLPKYLEYIIKNRRFPMEIVDTNQQKTCSDFFSRYNKYEIMLIIYKNINSQEELYFVNEVFFKKKYIDLLFTNLDNKNFH